MEAGWVDRGLVVGMEERSKTMRDIWKGNGELMKVNGRMNDWIDSG